MDVINSRAWMAGKREMESAQTIILKPDSVLELSCFTSRLRELVAVGASWSNNAYDSPLGRLNVFNPGNPRGVGSTFTDLIVEGLYQYYGGSFYHTLGGGTLPEPPEGVCTAMAAVWDLVQCNTFEAAGFATLEQFTTTDPRVLPNFCTGYADTRMQDWVDNYNNAYPIPTVPGSNGSIHAVAEDELFEAFSPENCGDVTPIPTGLIINKRTPGSANTDEGEVKPQSYEDKVCPKPGCSFQPRRIEGENDKCIF